MKRKGERAIQQGSTRTPWRTSGECVSVMSPRRPLSARVCSSCCSHEGAPRRPPRQHSLSQSPCHLKRPRRSPHQPQLRLRLFQQGWPPPRPYLGRGLPRSCSPRPLNWPTRRIARVPHLGGPVQQDAVLGLQKKLVEPQQVQNVLRHQASSLPFPIRVWGWSGARATRVTRGPEPLRQSEELASVSSA